MKCIYTTLLSIAFILLIACGKKEENNSKIASPPQSSNVSVPLPDVGKADMVQTKADGYGLTASAATLDAMKTAILQVNGATIDTRSIQLKYGLDITDGKDSLSLQANEFAELVAQKSGGAITNFRIINIMEPKEKGGQFKVSIGANIAHFSAPKDSNKIKVVVAQIHLNTDNFNVGNEIISAQNVANDIRQQVSTALTNTGRFSVLDRESNEDIQSELDMIKTGEAPRAETGKIGQAFTGDVLWVGTINNLSYDRHAKKLSTTDHELVSYSGGWGMSQKMVNVATKQIMISDILHGNAPDIAPTTMGSDVKSSKVLQDMENEIVDKVVASILSRTFPVTVLSREGSAVVLSQGGQSTKIGSRYSMVLMGKELKDPQTGESLGRLESACCEVVIDKITPKLSYGHLENTLVKLENIPEGGLQLREKIDEPYHQKDSEGMKLSKSQVEPPSITKQIVDTKHVTTYKNDQIENQKEDGKW